MEWKKVKNMAGVSGTNIKHCRVGSGEKIYEGGPGEKI